MLHMSKKRTAAGHIDKLVYIAAIATPIMTLPQLFRAWSRDNGGVSAVTWGAYVVIAVIWLLYALKNRDKPLIILEVSAVILYSLIVVGLIIKH